MLVWQKAHALVLAVYRFSDLFPTKENFTLTSQLRRSAISVPANIAEGFEKKGPSDKLRFLNIAHGSLEESRYYLILAHDLGYGDSSPSSSFCPKSAAYWTLTPAPWLATIIS